MARKPREEPSGDSWMNTYSDLVTLLMTFFVLLFSMSSVNAEKWEAFVKAFVNPGDATSQIVLNADGLEDGTEPLPNSNASNQLGEGSSSGTEMVESELPVDFDDLYEYLKEYVEENNLSESVEVMKSEDGDNAVYIRFQNNIFFDPDRSTLRREATEILDYLGDCFFAVQDEIYIISINGHTADVANPNYGVSDWILSAERASRVADYLDITKHVDATKLRPMGYGKSFPIADNNTEEGRRQNRRVDITIVRDNSDDAGEHRVENELASLFDPQQFPKSGGVKDLYTPANAQQSAGTQPQGGEADNTPEPSYAGIQPAVDEPAAGTEPEPSSPES